MEDIATNTEAQLDLTKERDERCIPIAREVLGIIAECTDGKLGNQAPAHELRMSWEGAARQMLEVYLAKNLTLTEVSYVNQLVLQAVEVTSTLTVDSINASLDRLQQKLLDGKKLSELTLGEMDGILKGKEYDAQA